MSRLAADLYSGEVHYLLEMLQNADDCDFPKDGRVPTFGLTVTDFMQADFHKHTTKDVKESSILMVFEHCESGFKEKDVRAICDVAQSTKTNKKFIGKKGIGFKSVLKVTNTPIIHSGNYSFHFDAAGLNQLGYLIPVPLDPLPNFNTGTRVVLPLNDADA